MYRKLVHTLYKTGLLATLLASPLTYAQQSCLQFYSLKLGFKTLDKISLQLELNEHELRAAEAEFSTMSIMAARRDILEINERLKKQDVPKTQQLKSNTQKLKESGFLFGPLHQLLYQHNAGLLPPITLHSQAYVPFRDATPMDHAILNGINKLDHSLGMAIRTFEGNTAIKKEEAGRLSSVINSQSSSDLALKEKLVSLMSQLNLPTLKTANISGMSTIPSKEWISQNSATKMYIAEQLVKYYQIPISKQTLVKQLDTLYSITSKDLHDVFDFFLPEIHDVILAKSQGKVSRWASAGSIVLGSTALMGYALNMGPISNFHDIFSLALYAVPASFIASNFKAVRTASAAVPRLKSWVRKNIKLRESDKKLENKESDDYSEQMTLEMKDYAAIEQSMDTYFNKIRSELNTLPNGIYEASIYGQHLNEASEVLRLRVTETLKSAIDNIDATLQTINLNSEGMTPSDRASRRESVNSVKAQIATLLGATTSLRVDFASLALAYDRYEAHYTKTIKDTGEHYAMKQLLDSKLDSVKDQAISLEAAAGLLNAYNGWLLKNLTLLDQI